MHGYSEVRPTAFINQGYAQVSRHRIAALVGLTANKSHKTSHFGTQVKEAHVIS